MEEDGNDHNAAEEVAEKKENLERHFEGLPDMLNALGRRMEIDVELIGAGGARKSNTELLHLGLARKIERERRDVAGVASAVDVRHGRMGTRKEKDKMKKAKKMKRRISRKYVVVYLT
jgi:hypothetical protein